MGDREDGRLAEIRNLAWIVRYYSQQRSVRQRLLRHQAIQKLGLEVREALGENHDYEVVLTAVVDGLRPKEGSSF